MLEYTRQTTYVGPEILHSAVEAKKKGKIPNGSREIKSILQISLQKILSSKRLRRLHRRKRRTGFRATLERKAKGHAFREITTGLRKYFGAPSVWTRKPSRVSHPSLRGFASVAEQVRSP